MVNREPMIAIAADPEDPVDFDVSASALERGLMGRRIRRLRDGLNMTQQQFAQAFGIRLSTLRQYEMGRYMPPHAVRAYLKVIEAEPEMVRRAVAE